jgi:hypothetical protein
VRHRTITRVYPAAQERASKITSRGMDRLTLLQANALVAPVGPGRRFDVNVSRSSTEPLL